MQERRFTRLTALLALLVPAAYALFFSLLQQSFGYPAVMDLPAAEVLTAVTAAGPNLSLYWLGAMAAAVLALALALALHRFLAPDGPPWLPIATAAGVLAAVFTVLDLGQWVFLIPYLAERHADPAASAASREAVALVYEAFHRFVGVEIGLVLATLASAVWTGLTAKAMSGRPPFPRWLPWLGMAAGLVLLASILQPFGFAAWAAINTVGFGLWAAWLGLTGVLLWRHPQPPHPGS